MNSRLYIALAVILVLVLGFFGKDKIQTILMGTPAPAVTTEVLPSIVPSATPETATSSTTTNVEQITVTGTDFAFAPATLTVKKGQSVQLTFKNMGKYPHNLSLSTMKVATKTIQPGQQDTVTFTADKAGKFEFTCTVDSHADKGMVGTLTVQ